MTSTIWSGYTTLVEFKAALTAAGQTLSTDTTDDALIEDFVERASRRVDDLTGRLFYPRVETLYYDMPRTRELVFGDDLLEVLTLTNGNDVAIPSTEYKFKPANVYPKSSLYLTDITTYMWEFGSSSSSDQIIDLNAIWGYHEKYGTRAWKTAGTLGAAMADTTTLTFTMTAGHTLATGGNQIVRIGNELLQTSGVSTNTATAIARGDNGSTAATHLNGATVYVWQHMEDITGLALEIANMMYKSRFQPQAVESNTYMSGGGVVITPRSLPVWAQEVIGRYKRRI